MPASSDPSKPGMFDEAALPARSLSVGVTGHRLHRLGPELVEHVTAISADVIRAIRGAGAATSQGQAEPVFRLVTALADGADTIFGNAALEAGWRLDVVLPFAREDYLGDFAPGDAQATFRRLLDASGSVFELHEPRGTEADEGVAYERAGRIVLSQSDILIAVWDNGPVRGRGGAAQMVAEAVLQNIPVIHIDPGSDGTPSLLWDGLEEHDLGQQTIDTVPRGQLDALPRVVGAMLDPPEEPDSAAMLAWFLSDSKPLPLPAFAFDLLLAATGVRRPRWGDLRRAAVDPGRTVEMLCGETLNSGFGERVRQRLAPRFGRAETAAAFFARLFRSGYVTNFSFAALAVLLTLLGLALPGPAKPVLIVLELTTIAVILGLTRAGRRGGWHRRWLDARQVAERLRCLLVTAQFGELGLRGDAAQKAGWVEWYVRATAREIGLPSARIDRTYLECCRDNLTRLIDDQTAYLAADAQRMHRLEHRLHLLGTGLFGATALTCVGLFLFELLHHLRPGGAISEMAHPLLIATTIASAALPALGAAIYGIRMQGDFAGGADRSEGLRHQLAALRTVMSRDTLDFDTLRRRALRAADILTSGLGSWLHTYHARPLSLPG